MPHSYLHHVRNAEIEALWSDGIWRLACEPYAPPIFDRAANEQLSRGQRLTPGDPFRLLPQVRYRGVLYRSRDKLSPVLSRRVSLFQPHEVALDLGLSVDACGTGYAYFSLCVSFSVMLSAGTPLAFADYDHEVTP